MDTQDQPQSLNLQLADIVLALQIIKVASERGAFKTEEYSEVGGCYDRIFKFLEASGAIQRTDTPEAPEAPATPPAEETKPAAKKAAAKKPAIKNSVAKATAKPKGKK